MKLRRTRRRRAVGAGCQRRPTALEPLHPHPPCCFTRTPLAAAHRLRVPHKCRGLGLRRPAPDCFCGLRGGAVCQTHDCFEAPPD